MRTAIPFLLALAACTGGDDDGGETCTPVWFVDAIRPGSTATIADGRLALTAVDAQGRHAIEAALRVPDGDFDVTFEVASFVPAGPGAYVGVELQGSDGAGDDTLRAALQTDPEPRVAASAHPSGPSDARPSALTTGTLRVQRAGLDVTLTASTADATATITDPFDYDRLVLAVHLGSTGPAVPGTSTATIEAMRVAAGAFPDDEFTCDTIRTTFD